MFEFKFISNSKEFDEQVLTVKSTVDLKSIVDQRFGNQKKESCG